MKHQKIFLVDDSELILETLARLIKQTPFIIAGIAKNVATALEWLASNQTDAIILDLNLPDGNGLDILNWLNKSGYNAEVIVLSNFTSEPVASEALKAGARKVFDKSSEIDSFIAYLQSRC